MRVSSIRSTARSNGRNARVAIHGQERSAAESALVGHLKAMESLNAGSIGVFVAHDGEPDLAPLVSWLWDRKIEVALPVLKDDPQDFSMRFVPWHRHDVLGVGRYDIPVPPAGVSISPETLLVSFTAFDAQGHRMGRGGGFFDRYLAKYQGNVIGVGFEAQRVPKVPTESHDQPLGVVVTDMGIRFMQ